MSVEAKSKGKLGYPDYARIPDDGLRHEVIDGEHIVNPAPHLDHQRLSRKIQFQLYTQIELQGLGEVFNAPCDLQLSEWDIVQPDLIVVLKRRQDILTPTRLIGLTGSRSGNPVGLVRHHDRVRKLELYRKSAIPEYWIVDPDQRVVEQYLLRGDAYELVNRHADAIDVSVVDGVRVDLRSVW